MPKQVIIFVYFFKFIFVFTFCLCILSFSWGGSFKTVSVSRSVGQYFSWSIGPLSVFSKMAHRILRKLYMKLEGLNGQKLMEPNFSEKFSFWGKRPKFPQNYSFLAFSKNWVNWCLFLPKKWCITVHFDSVKVACLEKVYFFSYGLKCSHCNILSLYTYLVGIIRFPLFFA